jgi:hypothetical protein
MPRCAAPAGYELAAVLQFCVCVAYEKALNQKIIRDDLLAKSDDQKNHVGVKRVKGLNNACNA